MSSSLFREKFGETCYLFYFRNEERMHSLSNICLCFINTNSLEIHKLLHRRFLVSVVSLFRASKNVLFWLSEALFTYIGIMSAINELSVSSHTYSPFKKGALLCITANQLHEKPVGIKAN